MSKLIYLMPVWMGCDDYLVHGLQVCQNKAARLVTKLDKYTPSKVLMTQCGWLPVRQQLIFHSLVLLHKVFLQQTPTFLYQKIISGSGKPNTRQAAAKAAELAAAGVTSLPSIPDCTLSLTRSSWCWSSVSYYNRLPAVLLTEKKVEKFKTRLKKWVTEYVEY